LNCWNSHITAFSLQCFLLISNGYVLSHTTLIVKGEVLSYSLPSIGPEVIPMYRQTAAGDFLSYLLAVGCYYFPPDLWSPFQPKNLIVLRPVPVWYCLMTEAQQLAQGCYAALSQWELNPWRIDRKSDALHLHHCVTL